MACVQSFRDSMQSLKQSFLLSNLDSECKVGNKWVLRKSNVAFTLADIKEQFCWLVRVSLVIELGGGGAQYSGKGWRGPLALL